MGCPPPPFLVSHTLLEKMSVPSAPQIVPRPLCRDEEITFYWQPPASNGGSAITGYTLYCPALSIALPLPSNVLSYTVTGAPNQVDYAFSITATNSTGEGPAADFRTVQSGSVPQGSTYATVSTVNESTARVTWDLSTIATEAQVKWMRIRGIPSTIGVSSFSWATYPSRFESIRTNLSTNCYYQFAVQAVNDVGYSYPPVFTDILLFGGTFTPTIIGNLALWLDAADATSVTLSGSDITAWADKSGGGNNSTLKLGGLTYSTNVKNGHNVSVFNAGALFGNFSPEYTGSSITYFFVGTLSGTNSQYASIMSIGLLNTPDYSDQRCMNVLGRSDNSSDLVSYRNLGPYTPTTISPGGYNIYVLVAVVVNNNVQTVYLNGTQASQVTYDYTPNFDLEGWSMGNSVRDGSLSTQYTALSGVHAESAMYEAALSTNDRQKMEGYLAWKWGMQSELPVGHPYKYAAP